MMNLEELVKEFADSVAAQAKAIADGNPNLGNAFARQSIAAFKKLRLCGNSGREALSLLFNDSRPEVRIAAAAYLLRYKHGQARMVLEAEAKGRGLVAFEAVQVLKRWDEGAWALDPADEK